MSAHEFTLILDHVPTGEELDALLEAACDDATPETVAGSGRLHFDRDAASLTAPTRPPGCGLGGSAALVVSRRR